MKKCHRVQGQEVAANVKFCVFLRNVAQAETSALVHCQGGFVSSLTTTFLVTCGMLCCGNATELVNNIHYLLCGFLD
jgi:hypothetical protein